MRFLLQSFVSRSFLIPLKHSYFIFLLRKFDGIRFQYSRVLIILFSDSFLIWQFYSFCCLFPLFLLWSWDIFLCQISFLYSYWLYLNLQFFFFSKRLNVVHKHGVAHGVMVIVVGNGHGDKFKSSTRLIAFHIALIPLGKVWIQLFSLQLWINSRADRVLQPWLAN